MTSNFAYFYDNSQQTYVAVSHENGSLVSTFLEGDRHISSAPLTSFDGLEPATADTAASLHIYLKQIHKDRLVVVDGRNFIDA